jgi:hypothetical protein
LSGLLSSTCATSSLGEVTFSVSKLYDWLDIFLIDRQVSAVFLSKEPI